MKKTVLYSILAALLLPLFGCGKDSGSSAKVLGAGIPPVAGIVEAVAGKDFQVVTLLPEGKSPHDYNPDTRNIRDLSQAALFFNCGLPVEEKAVKMINAPERCVSVTKNIHFIDFDDDDDDDAKHEDHHHHHDGHDPHVWLNVDNLIVIGENVRDALIAKYPDQQELFNANFNELKQSLLQAKTQMLALTADSKGKKLFVYHPAFGYFAQMVEMQQCAIELEGREPSPRQLAQVIKTMNSENAKLFLAQTGFSGAAAQSLQRQTGVKVVEINVLSRDIVNEMINICKAIKSYE